MTTWKIDPAHTTVEFVVTHMMFTKVRGRFTKVSGTITFDPTNPAAAAVEGSVDVNSVTTGSVDRDNHLKSADFFNAAQHPHITFKSTAIKADNAQRGLVTGDLTINGITKQVTFEVEFVGEGKSPFGTIVGGFSAKTRINREDFGLTWNAILEAGGLLVSKEVDIVLEIQAVKETVAETA